MKSIFSLIILSGVVFLFSNCTEVKDAIDSTKSGIEWCQEYDTASTYKDAIATISSSVDESPSSDDSIDSLDCTKSMTKAEFDELYIEECTTGGCTATQ